MDIKNYSLTETAKLIREALKAAFPDTKFSVRSSSYSMGSSINVSYTDGPLTSKVDAVVSRFEGADFDGSQDLKTYRKAIQFKGELVKFGVDFVHVSRRYSDELMTAAAKRVAEATGLSQLEVKDNHLIGGNQVVDFSYCQHMNVICEGNAIGQREYYDRLVYNVMYRMETPHKVGVAEVPQFDKEHAENKQLAGAAVN